MKEGTILGTIAEATYGICAFLNLDEKKKKLLVKSSLNKNFSWVDIHFDVSEEPAPHFRIRDENARKYSFLNKNSTGLLQTLKWPEEFLLLFKSHQEALKVLKVLFPNPKLVEAENLNIRVGVSLLDDIDWKFQSSCT